MKNLRVMLRSLALAAMLLAGQALPAYALHASAARARFSHPLEIDNPYFPLSPGTTFVYDGTDGKKSVHDTVTVTDQTRTVKGVQNRVVHDTVFENGKMAEDTFDWYAQDDAGNVWYFGEDSTQYKNGKVVSHEGSWEAGVNGASEGIIMEARPRVGDTYAQESAPGVGQDTATVISLDESVCVPYGCFDNVLHTEETSPLDPGVVDAKYYAPGIGEIKEASVQGGSEFLALTTITK